MKITMQGKLLTIAAVIELLTEPDAVGLIIGRVTGAALLALGISCWGARSDSGGAARSGTLWAITLYNIAVGFLLVVFGAMEWLAA